MEKEESKIEKYSMKFQRISMISIFILSLFTFIYDTTPIYAVVAQKNNPITVANVNIIDIVSSYSTSTFTFSGKFSLQGKMGQQNDVIYGILVLGKNNTILDAKELGIVPHINEDENQKYTFSYTISPFIKGDINVFLIANTSAGLTLSASQIFQGNILGKEINFPCSYIEKTRTDKSKIECVSSKNQLLNMEYRKGSVLTASIIKETVILEPNKKITVSPNIEPGEYFIIITTPTNEKRIFPFTKDGDYGVISSVVVHTSDIKNKIETVILSQVSTSSIVSIRLISAKG